jgi:hypothetical protein
MNAVNKILNPQYVNLQILMMSGKLLHLFDYLECVSDFR